MKQVAVNINVKHSNRTEKKKSYKNQVILIDSYLLCMHVHVRNLG